MTKTLLFLLLTLFLCRTLFAQEYERLQTFSDYSRCSHGLRTISGKIILEPVYDRINFFQTREDRTSEYWIVTQSEKVGIINEKGQWLFPLEYDYIKIGAGHNYFICTKDSSTNVYDKDLKLVFAGEGISRMDEFETGYIATKGNRTGVMNFQFEWVIPFQYQFVNPKYLQYRIDCDKAKFQYPREGSESCSEYFFQHFYEVQNEHGLGIVNEQNEVIIPCSHVAIDMVASSYYFQDAPRFFIALDNRPDYSDYTKYVYSIEGKPINPIKQDTLVNTYFSTDSTGSTYHCFALYRNKTNKRDRYKIVNILTLEQSEYYDDISVFYDRILVQKGTLWSVLTDQLDVIWSGKQSFANWQNIDREDYKALVSLEEVYYPWFESYLNDIQFTSQYFWIQETVSEKSNIYAAGLLNYQRDLEIPPLYKEIVDHELNGEHYFWAFGFKVAPTDEKLPKRINEKVGKIDVYNDRFELLNTIDQGSFLHARDPIYDRKKEHALFFAEDEQKAKKIYDLSGKLLFQDYFSNVIYHWNTDFFTLVDNNNAWGLYNFEGTQVLPHDYQAIYSSECYTWVTRHGLSTIYDTNFRVIVDSVMLRLASFKTEKGFNFTLSPKCHLQYLEIKNQLYLLNDYTLVPVNDQTFEILGNYLVLSKELIADRNGQRIEITSDMILYDNETYPYSLEFIPRRSATVYQATPSPFTGWQSQNLGNYRSVYHYYRDGKKVSETGFDKSFTVQDGVNAASVNDRHCFVDGQLKQIGTAYYSYIIPYKGWISSDKTALKWHDETLQKVIPNCTGICLKNPPGRTIVLQGSNLSVLSDSMTPVFPVKQIGLINYKDNLTRALGINPASKEAFTLFYHLIHHPDTLVTNVVNNAQIIWHATQFAITPANQYEWEISRVYRQVNFANPYFVSFSKRVKDVDEPYTISKATDLENYILENNQLRLMRVSDLVPDNHIALLDELLVTAINKGQYFGDNCVNLQERLNFMKQCFLINGDKLSFFYLPKSTYEKSFVIHIPFSDLKALIEPETFIKLSAKKVCSE